MKSCGTVALKLPPEPPRAEPVPLEVMRARQLDWGVLVDAYLVQAARVGRRYAAVVYFDHSGAATNGSTIATPPVQEIASIEGFRLLQTLDRSDHYVIVSTLSEAKREVNNLDNHADL